MKKSYYFLILGMIVIILACTSQTPFPRLKGDYLGQKPPGDSPELFAPGIICTGMSERDIAMMPDGSELYYGVIIGNNTYSFIMVSKQIDGQWTKPVAAPFSDNLEYRSLEPFISPDGKKFYFVSNRPDEARGIEKGNWDIWVMDRTENGWSDPYNLGSPVNTDEGEFYPSVTIDGTIYFTRGHRINFIYRSHLENGKYTEPEKLPEQVNSGFSQYNAFVAPDESYIIVPTAGREDSYGGCDYYISFRNEDDTWIGPVNMGEKINTPDGREYSPYVSSDGKYFFFMSTRVDLKFLTDKTDITWSEIQQSWERPNNGNSDIYWVDAAFIHDLKPQP